MRRSQPRLAPRPFRSFFMNSLRLRQTVFKSKSAHEAVGSIGRLSLAHPRACRSVIGSRRTESPDSYCLKRRFSSLGAGHARTRLSRLLLVLDPTVSVVELLAFSVVGIPCGSTRGVMALSGIVDMGTRAGLVNTSKCLKVAWLKHFCYRCKQRCKKQKSALEGACFLVIWRRL